jgi:hypothetical protein
MTGARNAPCLHRPRARWAAAGTAASPGVWLVPIGKPATAAAMLGPLGPQVTVPPESDP